MSRRLQKEFNSLKQSPPPNFDLLTDTADAEVWQVRVSGASDTLYAGETFTLQFRFTGNYPFDSPEVVFVGTPPVHPHIYSNGHICLSILDKDWSPALGVGSVCTSILSMLSSCKLKEKPEDDSAYMARWMHKKWGPKQTTWVFHDDTV